ncbi:PH domain-containing protein [Paramicrobacterium agarici]|uniref:PH (Pleckstrin Homology) domain-containing protein n=1 Tax=Paramicrobacterium agarici TaxID=630514 RepID=A0A2A9E0G1_9MICO|nr:PH domain-containing protein [Microbacterium agarici]PFG31679.1 PH (Pleckstrin Homology) domain-containing protein [Microbacterium agarici]TQO21583.1 PH (Pleckstrin Homology) domain-containing protein [Microbacterium agarici]
MPQRSVTYRSSFSIGLVIIVAVLAAFLTVDAAVRGFWNIALLTALWSIAVVAPLTLFLALPRLTADEAGLTCVGPFTTWVIPWSKVDTIRTRRLLLVETTEGTVVTLFSVPGRPTGARAAQSTDLGDEVEAIRRDWEGRSSPDAVITRRLHVRGLTIVGAAVLAAVAASIVL